MQKSTRVGLEKWHALTIISVLVAKNKVDMSLSQNILPHMQLDVLKTLIPNVFASGL